MQVPDALDSLMDSEYQEDDSLAQAEESITDEEQPAAKSYVNSVCEDD